MNLRINPLYLSVFFLSIFFSCENPTDIGLEGVGDNSTLGTFFTDTEEVKAATILDNDSILAFRRSNLLVGKFTNPPFGTVTAKSFLEVGLEGGTAGSTFTDAANATIDSMVLVLDYDEYYGDTTENITIQVHRLTEGFDEKKSYFTNSSLAYNEGMILGSKTLKPLPREKQVVKRDIKDANGVIIEKKEIKRSYPVRIKLNNSFANDILKLSGTSKLTNPEEFLSFWPGIALTAGNDAKAIVGFNFRNAQDSTYQTYLSVFYRSGDNKKQRYNFIINPGNNFFTQLITTNPANTTLAGLQSSGDSVASTNTNNVTFLQESTGIKTKISFPNLRNFKKRVAAEKNLENIVINRAELVVPVKTSYPIPSPFLYLFETNKTNEILRLSGIPRAVSIDGGGNLFNYSKLAPLVYNSEKKSYSINVTSYVQAIISGTSVQGRSASPYLILSPASPDTPTPTGNEALALQTLRQTVLSMEPGNPIKLRIYYSAKQ